MVICAKGRWTQRDGAVMCDLNIVATMIFLNMIAVWE